MRLHFDKLSANSAQPKWGKYRIAMDDYIYDTNGRMIGFIENGYEKYKRMGARFDKVVDKMLINGKL